MKQDNTGGVAVTWIDSSEPYLRPQGGGAADAWTQAGGSQRIISAGEMVPPPEVAAALGIAPGTPAIGRRRLMSLDGLPFEVAESWWPVSIAGGTALAEPRRIKGGAVTLLAEMGYTVHRSLEDVWATAAPEEEASLLGIEPGSPVLVMLRTAFNEDGLAFQVDPAMRLANARQRYELTAN